MLRSLKDLETYRVRATDGDIGTVLDFLVDDQRWVVRYVVVKTGSFFNERDVLLSPISFRQADGTTQQFHVSLTKEKVKHSPGLDAHQPVSRQYEREYSRYYGYPAYWGYPGMWGMSSYPSFLAEGVWDAGSTIAHDPADASLRSAKELRGYHIEGSDAEVGHVSDFIIDDETWAVRYLVVDTSNWLVGKRVLVAPHWASAVSWDERKVHVRMSRDEIKGSPVWHPDAPVNREYETRLYDFYGRPAYWSAEGAPIDVKHSQSGEVQR